jgi:hypothetical protein
MRGEGLLIIDVLIIGERLYVQDYTSQTATICKPKGAFNIHS